MAAKNQNILETFIVNILATTAPEERAALVESGCRGDTAVFAAVTSLLANQGGTVSIHPEASPPSMETDCEADIEVGALVSALRKTAELDEADLPSKGATQGEATLPWEPQAGEPEQIPAQIGHYTLIEKIGEGTFGMVYLAEQ